MHRANELRGVQLEWSSNCQAGCMECGRWKMHGDKQILNPNIKLVLAISPIGVLSNLLLKIALRISPSVSNIIEFLSFTQTIPSFFLFISIIAALIILLEEISGISFPFVIISLT